MIDAWLAAAPPGGRLRLELAGLDVESGEALATLISLLRAWAAQSRGAGGAGLLLVEAPQDLAHTLYKIGALERSLIVLQDPRSDQGRLGG